MLPEDPPSPAPQSDLFELQRFVSAQAEMYEAVVAELRAGQKRSHWMWYIFPQIDGLGFSETTKFFAIKSSQEALAYLEHPILGARLLECSELVLRNERPSICQIFPYPDDLKLQSSMTLFEKVSAPKSVFAGVLDKYFDGERDSRTLEKLAWLTAQGEFKRGRLHRALVAAIASLWH